MKHLHLTTIAAVLLVGTAFADPIHDAARTGDLAGVQAELDKGADVNVKDGFGRTPLDAAELVYEWDSPDAKAAKKNIADIIRKHQLIPRLTYSRELSGFSFTAKDAKIYVVEVTQNFKQWGELETIEGTGKQAKFNDPRQPLVPFKRNFYRVKVVE